MARLARLALQTPPPPSPEIPQSQLDGARLVTNRIELLRRFPKGGRICELGTDRGNFARQILDIVQPDELHLVDVTLTHCRVDVLQDARAHLHEMTTVSFLRQDKGADFDWIYVDADHSYAAVRRDIEAACPRVKPGGMLSHGRASVSSACIRRCASLPRTRGGRLPFSPSVVKLCTISCCRNRHRNFDPCRGSIKDAGTSRQEIAVAPTTQARTKVFLLAVSRQSDPSKNPRRRRGLF